MAAGVRAIFIPSEAVADQCARAQRMETLGVGTAIFPGDLRVEFLQRAIERTLHSPRPSAAVSLDGAEFTKRFMERILKESRP
jgi:predicted glycosyltransferase